MPLANRFRDSGNLILDHLPADEFDPLAPLLKPVNFAMKQVIYQFEARIEFVYFPTTALASLLTIMNEDAPVEAATIGREGIIGSTTALASEESPHRVICQLSGDCLRLPVDQFRGALDRSPTLAMFVRRYITFSLRNAGQLLACNAIHTIEARACRWLLMMHDQSGRDEFPITQEFLAYMLGVRRQSVTVVAGALQNAGLIGYRRGAIQIRDREGLEDAACECYASIRSYLEKIFI